MDSEVISAGIPKFVRVDSVQCWMKAVEGPLHQEARSFRDCRTLSGLIFAFSRLIWISSALAEFDEVHQNWQ